MTLAQYKKKRNFAQTPEPGPEEKQSPTGRIFVVQKHDASRLHYDFRLELDGALLSWAVPKGPSLDPADKRLAMHVEDHPLDYANFEGIIPEGNYGAGTVMLWDRGEWEPLGDAKADYRAGKLKFRLHGEKLRGAWMLVKTKSKSDEDDDRRWLLFKERDDEARPAKKYDVTKKEPLSVLSGRDLDEIAHDRDTEWTKLGAVSTPKKQPAAAAGARKAPMPGFKQPMLATLAKSAPTGDNWFHELKYDGYRILAFVDGKTVTMLTRNNQKWTSKFGPVASALKSLNSARAVLDGEVVVVTSDGATDFQALQNYIKEGGSAQLVYYVFDLLHLEDQTLAKTPLLERKALLKQLLDESGLGGDESIIRFSDHVVGQGANVFKQACQLGMEGIICKRADSTYQHARSRDWLKVKCVKRQEFVVGGFTDPSGSRNAFGALVLGVYDKPGKLVYVGKAGTGFTEASLRELHAKLKKLEQKQNPFAKPPTGADARGVHWVAPKLVAEVDFGNWTRDGILRHPSFQGLREDKNPEEVIRESGMENRESGKSAEALAKAEASAKAEKKTSAKTKSGAVVAGVTITNPDRELYPEQGITKHELAEYYEYVAKWMLPHVGNRALSLVRCPEGRKKECFYQKHLKDTPPKGIGGVDVSEDSGKKEIYSYVKDAAGLVSLTQMGVLEIHPWGSRVDNLERPDIMIFDMDPGTDLGLKEVIAGTFELRDELAELGLESFLKTTGGKGYHVVVPIARRIGWDDFKEFSKRIAQRLEKKFPNKYISTMSKAKRGGKIFIDYLRNGRGATAIGAYSTRAREGAPVSTPIEWEELSEKIPPNYFTVKNIAKRLDSLKRDPWEKLHKTKQSITAAMLREVGMK